VPSIKVVHSPVPPPPAPVELEVEVEVEVEVVPAPPVPVEVVPVPVLPSSPMPMFPEQPARAAMKVIPHARGRAAARVPRKKATIQ